MNYVKEEAARNNYANNEADITPDISLMKKMASISGTIPSRLMELVDNSIDARIPGQKLRIDVNIIKRGTKQHIEVIDNGAGMTELVARSFFRLGDSQKGGKRKIGKFGLGAKVAILGLGNTCKIDTHPQNESYCIGINFDIQAFKDWKIRYKVRDNETNKRGTKIRIDNLTVRIGNTKRFCERIQEQFAKAYKHFIESGEVELYVNGTPVTTFNVDLIPELHKEFDFTLRSGKRVHGWAGAMKKAGQNWKFGFDLISHGRIVKANDFLTRQAHTSLARLTGEIHLDDFPTDVHKTDFLRDNDDFQEMQVMLIEQELADLITKITRLTNREVFTKYQNDMHDVSKMLNRVIRNYDFLNHIDIEGGIFQDLKSKAEKERNKEKKKKIEEPKDADSFFEELNQMLQEDATDTEEVDETLMEEEKEPEKQKEIKKKPPTGLIIEEPVGISAGVEQPSRRWVSDEFTNGVRLLVEVNLDHPTYQEDNDLSTSVYMKNAVMDSVAEFILQEEKKQNGLVEDEIDRLNRIKDMLIRYSMAI